VHVRVKNAKQTGKPAGHGHRSFRSAYPS
jgi:hypothetical protein